jgi:ketosteroid isomerase-like protein
MSSECASAELLEAMFAAFNRHDADGVLACMTDDCVFEAAAGPEAHGRRIHGRDAVAAAFSQVWASMPDVQWRNTRHFVAGDRGVSEWTFVATRPDGSRIEADGCDLFTFRDGKVAVKQAFRKDRPDLPATAD